MYRYVLGLPVDAPQGFVEGLKWIHEERDILSALRMWRQGQLSLRDWLSSYHGRRTYALAAWDDPGPLRAAMLRLCKRPLSFLRPRKKPTAGGPLQASATKIPERKSA
jgi:predicted ATP-grasp superfamily ATP-dependent carboligase